MTSEELNILACLLLNDGGNPASYGSNKAMLSLYDSGHIYPLESGYWRLTAKGIQKIRKEASDAAERGCTAGRC